MAEAAESRTRQSRRRRQFSSEIRRSETFISKAYSISGRMDLMRLSLFAISSHPAAWLSQWNLRLCSVLFHSIGSGSYQTGRDFEFGDVHLVYSRRSSGAFVPTGMTANGRYRRTFSSFAWYEPLRPYHRKGSGEPGRDAMVDMLSPELHSGTEEADEAQVPAVSWAAVTGSGGDGGIDAIAVIVNEWLPHNRR